MRSIPILASGIFALIAISFLDGCCRSPVCMAGIGGGEDSVTIDMPFTSGERLTCSQGVGGGYSHHFDSTYYDVDFDTPNDSAMPLYAPVSGVAYVHDLNEDDGFGIHVNIDMGDGTYVLLGHLSEMFVDNGSEVAAGQLIGYEGTTGDSTGDHVHVGRHDGDAARDATLGTSLEGLALRLDDATSGNTNLTLATGEMTCALPGGHVYASHLATPKWHPNGSLVKTPSDATVYVIEGGAVRPFLDEASFWSRGYDFGDVALIDEDELACYDDGSTIQGQGDVHAVYDGGTVWLIADAGDRATASRVHTSGWQAVLKSWGITAATYDDLPTDSIDATTTGDGYASFRDGSLVSEVSSATVYVISDGIAMPIETWEAYLLLGFEDRSVIEVDDGVVRAVMERVGDCTTNAYCVSRDDVLTCGGPSTEEATYEESSSESASTDQGGADASDILALSWRTPGNATADRITLSGEWTVAGSSEGWKELDATTDAASILYSRERVTPGDSLRFSVECEEQGRVSWSCLAPFPPGTVQGSVTAVWGATTVPVVAADDPSSNGCGLTVTVPE